MKKRCVLCKKMMNIDAEPEATHQRNPETFRLAWLHWQCFRFAYEEMEDSKNFNPVYSSRTEEYEWRFD